jgi:hypothetical protein
LGKVKGIDLADSQERNRVNVCAGERPSDVVASMDPNFVGKKRNRLLGHVRTLAPDGSVPIQLCLNSVRETQDGREQRGENTPHFDKFLCLHLLFSYDFVYFHLFSSR